MRGPDTVLTDDARTLLAAIGTAEDSPEVAAATALLQEWTGHAFEFADDGGTRVLWATEGGAQLSISNDGTVHSVYFQIQPTDKMQPFEHLHKVFESADPATGRDGVREVLGEPAITEYGLDKYLLNAGHQLSLKYRNPETLSFVTVGTTNDAGRARLQKAAARKAANKGGLPLSLEVTDEDGILAVLDVAAATPIVDGCPDGEVIPLFADLINDGHGVVWMTGSWGYGEWVVTVTEQASDSAAHREATVPVTVTDGRLHLVTFGELTTAADDLTSLADVEPDRAIPLANGTYDLRLRQLFDPADPPAEPTFEIVVSRAAGTGGRTPVTQALWWSM